MSQPILYLLKPKFKDPTHGDADFFCPQCAPIEVPQGHMGEYNVRPFMVPHGQWKNPVRAHVCAIGVEHPGDLFLES